MYDMLRKYMEGGKMYEHGGEHGDPTGKTTSKGFRIIPTKAEGGFDKLSYYIDGQPMSAEDFRGRYYDAGNTPENLQNLIRNSYEGQIGGGGTGNLASEYRKSLEERDVYSKKGRPGIDSLYNARTDSFEDMMRRRGGVEGKDY
tara:strand:+ start:1772 stop:2203 length:432 start_codon:yes stop_codon:yes gene_type:complete